MTSAAEGPGARPSAAAAESLDPEDLPAVEGRFSKALAGVCVVLLMGVLATVLLQVVMRYGFNSPLTWTDEATRLQLVWLTFIGAALAYRMGSDIAVDALEQLAAKRCWTWVASSAVVIIQGTIAIVAVIFVVAGWQLVQATMARDTPALDIPVATFYAAVPSCGVLLLLSLAERAWRANRARVEGGTE
ncbi:C4-dicarboxylate transporter, DctQ subunit [Amycolatopsis marina]|uniref:C4-dicarboxylate transporter, DctQ subunit n=1 Tax=Amycolatopsis marina TaxID=490629 RepID=A0A1I1BU66_9PSEU|nr:TRAP transporter small permease [Amycolatopsis marina]SFB53831.1 C4-dicarboxylate transporter, DctQ subunit [Amycolatopsis marina]